MNGWLTLAIVVGLLPILGKVVDDWLLTEHRVALHRRLVRYRDRLARARVADLPGLVAGAVARRT